MTQEKKTFPYIPVLSINNIREKKIVDVDGVDKEVELPADEGFRIETRDEEKKFNKEFFTESLEAVVLLSKRELRSKYGSKDFYFSNEFEYGDGPEYIRVYAPIKREVLYEGDYKGAAEHFDTGQVSPGGYPIKDFDVYLVLYISYNGKVYRYKQKMNQNCNWLEYRKSFENKEYFTHITKFVLAEKTHGSNTFWTCEMQKGEEVNEEEMKEEKTRVQRELDDIENFYKKKKEPEEKDIDVNEIPF